VAAGRVGEALGAASDALRGAGIDTPRLDAEVLLAEALGVERATLLRSSEEGVEPRVARGFGAMVRRRIQREPVAYILGRKGFRHIELAVDPRVLIPRPETELLVEVALELGPRTVLDVGTGSGAVALAVADELPHVAVTGTDISEEALTVARGNAQRLELADRVSFELAPYGSMAPKKRQPAELVVANLPYVPDGDWATLQPEIHNFEPREALLGGPDGLEPIRNLLSPSLMCDSIALEVGLGQAGEVERLVREAGFQRTERRRDLAGIERVVLGRSR
jgi:release factor glutamine methyltransferase